MVKLGLTLVIMMSSSLWSKKDAKVENNINMKEESSNKSNPEKQNTEIEL